MGKHIAKCSMSVNGLIIRENKILLQKLNREGIKGKIGLPGGKVDVGESFEHALKREIYEETGITSDLYDYKKLAILHDGPDTTCKHIYEITIHQKIDDFQFDPEEILEVMRIDINKIPQDLGLYRKNWVYFVIKDYLNGYFGTGEKLYTLHGKHENI